MNWLERFLNSPIGLSIRYFRGNVNHELRVTSSNPRVTSSNLRVRRLKAPVARLKVRVEEIKPRVK